MVMDIDYYKIRKKIKEKFVKNIQNCICKHKNVLREENKRILQKSKIN